MEQIENMKNETKEIEKIITNVITLHREQAKMEEELQEIEDNLYLEVYNELDDKGKSKYSNETLRGIEIRTRQKTNERYTELKNKIQNKKDDLELLRLKFDLSKKNFNINKLEILLHLNNSESNKDESTED